MSSAAGAGRERGRGWGAGPAWGGAGASPAPAAAGVGAALPEVGAAAGSHACPGLPPGRGPGAGRLVQRVGVAVSNRAPPRGISGIVLLPPTQPQRREVAYS